MTTPVDALARAELVAAAFLARGVVSRKMTALVDLAVRGAPPEEVSAARRELVTAIDTLEAATRRRWYAEGLCDSSPATPSDP